MRTRWAMRLSFVAAAVLGVVALVAPVLADENSLIGRPVVFSGIAAATGIHETFDRTSGLIVLGEPVWGNLADGSSTFSSGEAYGRASVIYPGRAVTKGPGLVCGQLPESPVRDAVCDFRYPLTVEADNEPDVQVDIPQPLGGADTPLSATAVFAKAHADARYVSTDASISAFRSAGVLVDSVAAHTRQAFDDKQNPALLTVTAISELTGLSLLDGMVGIDSILTRSVHRTDGRTVKDHKDHVEVSGVTVAGQPATITHDGIVVNGAGQGRPAIDALNAALQQALAAAGTKIHLIGTTTPAPYGNDQPCSEGSAGGVQVYTEQDLSQVPQQGGVFFYNIKLGHACTVAAASRERTTEVEDIPIDSESGIRIGGDAAPGAGDAGSTAGAAPSVDAGAGGSVAAGSSSARTSARAAPGSTATARRIRGGRGLFEDQLRGALVSHRLDILYLAFTLTFIGLCLAARIMSGRTRPSRVDS